MAVSSQPYSPPKTKEEEFVRRTGLPFCVWYRSRINKKSWFNAYLRGQGEMVWFSDGKQYLVVEEEVWRYNRLGWLLGDFAIASRYAWDEEAKEIALTNWNYID